MKEMQACDMLARFAKDKRPYISPQCEAIPVEKTNLICTSVIPKVPGSTEEDWDDENVEIGDKTL